MYSVGLWVWAVLGVVVAWLLTLSYFIYRQQHFLEQLFPKGNEKEIRDKFLEVLEMLNDYGKDNRRLQQEFERFKKQNLKNVQKTGIVKYNPYEDMGGTQSFSMALLDGNLNGFVLTGLHNRQVTRLYLKKVAAGKSDLELSKEEKEALEKAVNSQ